MSAEEMKANGESVFRTRAHGGEVIYRQRAFLNTYGKPTYEYWNRSACGWVPAVNCTVYKSQKLLESTIRRIESGFYDKK